MTIQFYTKKVYGLDTFYIKDPEKAEVISTLTGKRTVSANDLYALEQLGHTVEETMPPTTHSWRPMESR